MYLLSDDTTDENLPPLEVAPPDDTDFNYTEKGSDDKDDDDDVQLLNPDNLVMIFDQNNNTCYAVQQMENERDGLNEKQEWHGDGETLNVDKYVVADDQSIDTNSSPSYSSATLTDEDCGLYGQELEEVHTVEGERILETVTEGTCFTAGDIGILWDNHRVINGVEYMTDTETKQGIADLVGMDVYIGQIVGSTCQ